MAANCSSDDQLIKVEGVPKGKKLVVEGRPALRATHTQADPVRLDRGPRGSDEQDTRRPWRHGRTPHREDTGLENRAELEEETGLENPTEIEEMRMHCGEEECEDDQDEVGVPAAPRVLPAGFRISSTLRLRPMR